MGRAISSKKINEKTSKSNSWKRMDNVNNTERSPPVAFNVFN